MKKTLLLAILLIITVGCTTGENKTVDIGSPFIGGTQGLVISFQDVRPEVFDAGKDPFDIIVRLENKGETVVQKNDVQVKLSGINPAEFSKQEAELVKNAPDDVIEVRKDPQGNLINPAPTFVEFIGLNHKNVIEGAQAEFTIRADACYLYRTKAVSKLCIRENLLTPQAGGICEINADKPVSNSGAPVAFGAFKESTRASDKVGFSVELSNIGTGQLYERNSKCDKTRTKENRVYVIISTGISGVQCTGLETTQKGAEGFATLYGGKKVISCTQTVSSRADFEQIVNMEAIYDYEQHVQTQIKVKNSGEE